MKLEEIANVTIGIVTKREHDSNGKNSYLLFSLKNYEESKNYEELRTNKDLNNRLTQEGDLLFRLVYPNKIVYVDRNLKGKLVPSQFCIIRPEKEKIDSIVLKWYLEKEAKEEIEANITGSLIKSMTVTNLKKLKVPNISLEKQDDMKELITLWEKEKIISQQIIEEKEKLYNCYITKMMEKGENYVRRS